MNNQLIVKFLKDHKIEGYYGHQSALKYLTKVLYEFWGYCINGTQALNIPGGIPISGTYMPAEFENGTNILLASGSNAFTIAQQNYLNFGSDIISSSYLGKHIVLWKSGSSSTDDGIYRIDSVFNSRKILLNPVYGGTPIVSGTLLPKFTTRSNINYRVIDFEQCVNLNYVNDNFLILRFDGARIVNQDQLCSMAKLNFKFTGSTCGIGFVLSPSGSWNENTKQFSDNNLEIAAVNYFNNTTSQYTGSGHITLIGAADFLICHIKGVWNTNASGFHIEIPQRFYPKEIDPNLITMCRWHNSTPTIRNASENYGSDWYMYNDETRVYNSYNTMVKGLWGGPLKQRIVENYDYDQFTLSPGIPVQSTYNINSDQHVILDGILSSGLNSNAVNFYCASRCRLRRVRFIFPPAPLYHRYGMYGEWYKVTSTILWPWNNIEMPQRIFQSGT